MSDFNFPHPSSSLDGAFFFPELNSTNAQAQTVQHHTVVNDEALSSPSQGSTSFTLNASADNPVLPASVSDSSSMALYFGALSAAAVDLEQIIGASDYVDQATRPKPDSSLASMVANSLLNQFNNLSNAQKTPAQQAQALTAQLQTTINNMQNQTTTEQSAITIVNQGNAEEQTQYQTLVTAYNDYTSQLQSIGAINNGNGTYTVPVTSQQQYFSLTEVYQAAVQNFNSYWAGRNAQLQSAVTTYNSEATQNNQFISSFITDNKLAGFIISNKLPLPTQDTITTRDLSNVQSLIIPPSIISQNFLQTTVSVPGLPSYAPTIATNGPPLLNSIAVTPIVDANQYTAEIQKNLTPISIGPIQNNINKSISYWSFLQEQSLFNPVQDSIPDPLLNSKTLVHKLLLPANTDPTSPVQTVAISGAGALAVSAIGLGNPHIQQLLGMSLLTQAFNNVHLRFTQQDSAEYASQFLVLSAALIGNNSRQALFSSLSPIANLLNSLPKDSPVFALLFAAGFANVTQQAVTNGSNNAAIEAFLNTLPAFANLSAADKAQITAAINIGQLLVAAKLLETSLGLPGFISQQLPALVPSQTASINAQVATENAQNQAYVQQQISTSFANQGFSTQQANFLGQVGSQLVNQGLSTPSATTVSTQSINQQALQNSIQAGLILADQQNYDINQSAIVAQQAVTDTLAENSYKSTAQFRSALESNLQEIGVGNNSSLIANQAVIIPNSNPSPLTTNPPAATTPLPSIAALPPSSPTPPVVLSQTELVALLEQQSAQLLVPQLGAQLSQQVTANLAQTLFGNPNPSSGDVADVKSPFSLVNTVNNELYHSHLAENDTSAIAVADAFKETIKTSSDFYAFSLKVMDPAYLFVYSINAGIMYGGNEPSNWKKSVSIVT